MVHCTRPECNHDEECAFNLACRNERCEDPCNCGINAQCRVNSHRAQCRCPPGYVGDPLIICKIEEIKVAPQCSSDADCSSKLACFSGVCKNPCLITKPCGNNAVCSVVDTLPLRTMMCECERGYAGDADVGCRKGIFSMFKLLNLLSSRNGHDLLKVFFSITAVIYVLTVFIFNILRFVFYNIALQRILQHTSYLRTTSWPNFSLLITTYASIFQTLSMTKAVKRLKIADSAKLAVKAIV